MTDQRRRGHVNAGTCKPYRGSNILSLWIAAQAAGYTSGRWASYRQWQALGAQVRKGEQATTIVFWKINQRGEDAKMGRRPTGGAWSHTHVCPRLQRIQ
jgi:antirestriction protein ArdC